jgi:hypothetical protein
MLTKLESGPKIFLIKTKNVFFFANPKKSLPKIFNEKYLDFLIVSEYTYIQGVIESITNILTTSYWLHVELGKNT